MNKVPIHTTVSKSIIVACLLLFLRTSFVVAAEDIIGEWEMKIEHDGLERFATLSFSRKADGSLEGKWGSSELSDVIFEDGKLTFTRIVTTRARDFIDKYVGTLEEGRFKGTLSGDLGAFSAKMTRKKAKSPVLGQWDMKFNVGEREITGRLTISEKPNGTLAGKWEAEFGEHVVSNVKFKNGKLTYTRKSKFGERGWESTFDGTIKGHKLIGAFKSQRGELPATGERVGALLVGKWKLITTIYGTMSTSIMKIDGDLTGWYEFPGGDELPIKKLKLEGDQFKFVIEMGRKGLTLRTDFKGKLNGKTLNGQLDEKIIDGKLVVEELTKHVIGKKVEATGEKID